MARSPRLFEHNLPPGLHYRDDFITEADEGVLLDAIAQIQGHEAGFAKLVVEEKSCRIVGVHLLMEHADALIGEAALMVACELTLDQLAKAIHPHPTQSEMFPLLARRAMSRLSRKQQTISSN